MAEVKVPILDNTGKVAAAFWPDEVADLGANVQAAVEAEVAAEVPPLVTAHNNDTTSVHGIADTSVLVTETGDHAVSGTLTAGDGGAFAGVGAVTICTSGTRPAAPVEGQQIYETDTDAYYGWRGSMWLPIGGGATGHNLLHNGAMQVHQRGTSTSGLTSVASYATADRWLQSSSSLGTWTMSVENDAPTGSGFRKSLKMLCTTADASPAAADYVQVYQKVEGQNLQAVKKGTADAEQLTLSFWTKSNKTGTYVVEMYDADNTRSVSATYTVASSGTWEQQSITLPADLSGAFDNDGNASLTATFVLAAGTDFTSGTLQTAWASAGTANRWVGQTNLAASTNNYWQVTGVQLEVGSAATGFEHKDYGTELAECQRYYQHMNYGASDKFYPFAGDAYSTTILEAIYLPVTNFRATPTAVTYSNLALVDRYGASTIAVTGVAFGQAGQYAPLVAFTVASGLTAGVSYWVQTGSSSASYIGISADL